MDVVAESLKASTSRERGRQTGNRFGGSNPPPSSNFQALWIAMSLTGRRLRQTRPLRRCLAAGSCTTPIAACSTSRSNIPSGCTSRARLGKPASNVHARGGPVSIVNLALKVRRMFLAVWAGGLSVPRIRSAFRNNIELNREQRELVEKKARAHQRRRARRMARKIERHSGRRMPS